MYAVSATNQLEGTELGRFAGNMRRMGDVIGEVVTTYMAVRSRITMAPSGIALQRRRIMKRIGFWTVGSR